MKYSVHTESRMCVCARVLVCLPRLSANSWKDTDASAVQLVATTRSNDLKVERLIKLSAVVRTEAQLECNLTVR